MLQRYQQGEKALASCIVENNLGLIHLVLKRFKWAYNNHPKYDDIISYEDLFQEGVLGLYDSIRDYDSSQGAFSTYAIIHIRKKIFRFMYDKGRVIRVPQEPHRTMKRVRDTETLLAQKLQREPTEREIAKQAGISLNDLQELKQVFCSVASIDAPMGEDEDLKLSDIVEDKTDYIDGIERTAVLKSLKKDLVEMAGKVIQDKTEIKILFSYFERIGKKQVKDIAADYNISTSKLQRIINNAIGRIAARFLDELIDKYSDLFASSIRRTREKDLFQARQSRSIQRVASSLIKPGDNLTIISSLGSDGLKTSIQAAVSMISADWLSISYVGYDYLTGEYIEKRKTIYYSDIIDFRTENKQIVEIACLRMML